MVMWLGLAWAGWGLGPDAYVVEDVVVAAPGELVLEHGWLFDVLHDEEPVGMAFVGGGAWRVPVPDPVEALAVANQLVMIGGMPREQAEPLVTSGALGTEVEAAWFLGPEARDALAEGALAARQDGRVVVTTDGAGQTHLVVTGSLELGVARRRAERLLRERVGHHASVGLDLGALAAADRHQAVASGAAAPRWAEVRTTTDWGPLVGGGRQPWLQLGRRQGVVPGATVSVVVPTAPGSEGAPRVLVAVDDGSPRARVLGAAATVELVAEPSGAAAWQRHHVVLEVGAERGPLGVVHLAVPRVPEAPFGGAPELPSRFALGTVSIDGQAVTPWTVEQAADRVVLAVPVALAEGASATVAVRWLDRRRYAHAIELGVGGPVGASSNVQPVGTTTDAVQAFVALAGCRAPDEALAAALRVGVPHGGPDAVALSGAAEPRVTKRDGWSWSTTEVAYPRARVAMGRWAEAETEEGEVRLHLRTDAEPTVHQAARRITGLQEAAFALPPGPMPTVVELHAEVGRFDASVAPGALVMFHPYAAPPFHQERSEPYAAVAPSLSTWVMAHAAYGDRLAARPGPEPVREALGRAVATLTVQGVSGADVAEPWWRLLHDLAQPWRGYDVGTWGQAYTVGRSLPTLVGHAALADALGQLARGEREATWSGLVEALNEASGLDTRGVVAVHLAGGLAPEVRARVEAGAVHVESSMAFGTAYVPVRLEGGDETVEQWVVVVDGHGSAPLQGTWARPPRRVVVDPGRDWLFRRPELVSWGGADPMAGPRTVDAAPRTPEGGMTGWDRKAAVVEGMRAPGPPPGRDDVGP